MKNPNQHPTVDIQMRLVMPLTNYRNVGQIMDDINRAVIDAVGGSEARFDFVSFNTNPCKAIAMDEIRRYAGETSMGDDAEPEEDMYSENRRLRSEVRHLREEIDRS